MVLHFNVTGDSRKAMVKAIEKELGCKAKYMGMPSAAYEIGAYRSPGDTEKFKEDYHKFLLSQLGVPSWQFFFSATIRAAGW